MIYKLGDIAEISAGQGAPQGDQNYSDDGIPFVKAGNLQKLLQGLDITLIQKVNAIIAKSHKLKLYKQGTVLFAKSGMSCLKGYVYVLPTDAYVVSHIACITPLSVDSEYLRLYFLFHKPNQLVKDAAYPSISLSDIAEMEIEVPDGEKAKTIIASLKRVEKIIASRKQQLSDLDTLIKAQFVEMFGDPVSNPMKWDTSELRNNTTLLNGRAYKQDELLDNGKYPVLRVGNFFSNKSWYYSNLELEKDKYCENGDLLYAWSASFGPKIWNGGKVIYHYHIWKIIIGDSYEKHFLCKLLDYVTNSLMSDTHGIAMMHLTKSGMEHTKLIIPPIELQKQFADFVAQVNKSKVVYQLINNLLHKSIFSGDKNE